MLGDLLEQVDSYKYLGVIIDDALSWQPHTATIAVKLSMWSTIRSQKLY